MRMMMMTPRPIPERQVVERAVLAIIITISTARVRRIHRAVKMGLGKRREQRTGRGNGRGT
jgi:hypothetical protein